MAPMMSKGFSGIRRLDSLMKGINVLVRLAFAPSVARAVGVTRARTIIVRSLAAAVRVTQARANPELWNFMR